MYISYVLYKKPRTSFKSMGAILQRALSVSLETPLWVENARCNKKLLTSQSVIDK